MWGNGREYIAVNEEGAKNQGVGRRWWWGIKVLGKVVMVVGKQGKGKVSVVVVVIQKKHSVLAARLRSFFAVKSKSNT